MITRLAAVHASCDCKRGSEETVLLGPRKQITAFWLNNNGARKHVYANVLSAERQRLITGGQRSAKMWSFTWKQDGRKDKDNTNDKVPNLENDKRKVERWQRVGSSTKEQGRYTTPSDYAVEKLLLSTCFAKVRDESRFYLSPRMCCPMLLLLLLLLLLLPLPLPLPPPPPLLLLLLLVSTLVSDCARLNRTR